MKALILNSGLGKRMGEIIADHPKCMTEIAPGETIISRQLSMLSETGVKDIVITTGAYEDALIKYCNKLNMPLNITFVKNPRYEETNYIYSMNCARDYLDDDILLMHGDLVFEYDVLERIVKEERSVMVVSSSLPLPEKDFKAVIKGGRIFKVGTEFFGDALAAQPLYRLIKKDWLLWRDKIAAFCASGRVDCYAENALNEVLKACEIYSLDVRSTLCAEIDDAKDLSSVRKRLAEIERRTVYVCFSADVIHSGHISLIQKAQRYGRLMVGVLSDEAVASYKRLPLLPFAERKALFENIAGVWRVVEQRTLSYRENLEKFRPDYVVHGDDWREGIQKPIRDEVNAVLASYGGQLEEFPYADGERYQALDKRTRREFSLPDIRRGQLRRAIETKGLVNAMEAHNGLTGLIVENAAVSQAGGVRQFDAMWVSSLCDSSAKGKPDIELVDMTSRFATINDIMEVTTKPIIFDGDTGGLKEHFVYTVRTLERMGVSMVIIEDKKGLKKNSLFGTEVQQTQDTIENFSEKIRAGKQAQKTADFMICARIESLILEQGMEDAIARAHAFTLAGADAIMIHSRKKDPAEIFEFVRQFREKDEKTPVVVVPTSFASVTEEEFKARGVNVVIYANQLMRAAFPAMREAARLILEHHRAEECDNICMSFKEIIRLIPEE